MEKNRDFSEASITLDSSQALLIPVMSSCSLLLLFYLFVSQLLTAFTAIASVSFLFYWLSPYAISIKTEFGLSDPFVSRCSSKCFTRIQGLLLVACALIVVAWLISGHWVVNNLLGISVCIAFVSHVRLPNIKICAMTLVCLFVYDIFWVAMVAMATQHASNPVHTVANSLNLPGLQLISKKLELPVKIVFPRNLLGGVVPGMSVSDFMMLVLGDMAIPAMLLALVLCFDHRKSRDVVNIYDLKIFQGTQIHMVCTSGLRHWFGGCSSCMCLGPLTSASFTLSGTIYVRTGDLHFMVEKGLAELWEGPALSKYAEKSHEIEI